MCSHYLEWFQLFPTLYLRCGQSLVYIYHVHLFVANCPRYWGTRILCHHLFQNEIYRLIINRCLHWPPEIYSFIRIRTDCVYFVFTGLMLTIRAVHFHLMVEVIYELQKKTQTLSCDRNSDAWRHQILPVYIKMSQCVEAVGTLKVES